MPQSTAKKNLLESLDETPAKKIVSRQINSWMETNEKNENPNRFNIQSVDISRFKMVRKVPRLNMFSKRNSNTTNTNEQGLK